MEFVTLSTLPGIIGRYLMMLKVTDILDIAIMVFVFYKALTLIQSTRAASLLKGVLVFFGGADAVHGPEYEQHQLYHEPSWWSGAWWR